MTVAHSIAAYVPPSLNVTPGNKHGIVQFEMDVVSIFLAQQTSDRVKMVRFSDFW